MIILAALLLSSRVTAALESPGGSFPLPETGKGAAENLGVLAGDGTPIRLHYDHPGPSFSNIPATDYVEFAQTSFIDEKKVTENGDDAPAGSTEPHTTTETNVTGSQPAAAAAAPLNSRGSRFARLGQPMHVSAFKELASVVKIFVSSSRADFGSPWQVMAPTQQTGSGFIIEGQMIMTNAHLVADQTGVLVRKHGNPKRFIASVLAVCHECDLALLGVIDESFWEGATPLTFGGIPQLQDTVAVLGYPTGGDQLSITEGVVSRVGVSQYVHSSLGLLTVQIDAAINPGNSGGPAVSEGKVVGVAFQGFNNLQSLGYIVPYPVIRHFLNDIVLHKRNTGFVSVGIKAQLMENAALKRSKGLDAIPPHVLPKNVTPGGVLVTEADRVRINMYARGKIILPLSRYSEIALEGHATAECLLKQKTQGNFPSASGGKAAPCQPKSLALLEDVPEVRPGDKTENERQVQEIDARVIWQPENWTPSQPQAATCSREHPRAPDCLSAVKPHGSLLTTPENQVQINTPNQQPKPAEAMTNIGPATTNETTQNQNNNSNFSGGDMQASMVQITEANVQAGRNLLQESGSTPGVQPTATYSDAADGEGQASQKQDMRSANVAGNAEETAFVTGGAEPSSITGSSAASGAAGSGEIRDPQNPESHQNEISKINNEGSGSKDQTDQNNLQQKETAATAAAAAEASPLKKAAKSPQEKTEELLKTILGPRIKMSQLKNILESAGDETSEVKATNPKTSAHLRGHLRAIPKEETQMQEALQLTSPSAEKSSETKDALVENKQKPEAVVNNGKVVADSAALAASISVHSSEQNTKETVKTVQLKVNVQGVEVSQGTATQTPGCRLIGQPSNAQGNAAACGADHALAPRVHLVVDNPYFNSNLLQESEFVGLREGDVILSIGNYNIADDGTIAFRDLERVPFTYVVTHFFNGQATFAYVLRDGRIIKVTVPLMMPTFKVPFYAWDTKPSYFVYGGFVFTPLSRPLLQKKLHREAPHMFEYFIQRIDYQQEEGDEYVVLSLIFASNISLGYEQPPGIVRSINGHEVRNMRDVVRLIESTTEDFVKLQVEINGTDNIQLAIDRKEANAIQQKILTEHNIVFDRSPDLLR